MLYSTLLYLYYSLLLVLFFVTVAAAADALEVLHEVYDNTAVAKFPEGVVGIKNHRNTGTLSSNRNPYTPGLHLISNHVNSSYQYMLSVHAIDANSHFLPTQTSL